MKKIISFTSTDIIITGVTRKQKAYLKAALRFKELETPEYTQLIDSAMSVLDLSKVLNVLGIDAIPDNLMLPIDGLAKPVFKATKDFSFHSQDTIAKPLLPNKKIYE